MKNYCDKKDGYRETIQKGLIGARFFSRKIFAENNAMEERFEMLKNEIQNADSGLSKALFSLSIMTCFVEDII